MAELDIWMGGKQVGVLDGRDRRNLRVIYDSDWMQDPASTPLSVSMPLTSRVHSGRGVSAYLWGLLPDNERVLERWATAYQCSPGDVFALLKGVGADVAGAAQYLPPGEPSEEAGSGRIEPLSEHDVADLLRDIRNDATAWHPRGRSALGL